jgi:hypothetical protein
VSEEEDDDGEEERDCSSSRAVTSATPRQKVTIRKDNIITKVYYGPCNEE